jgi:hypothetical protein
LERFPEQGQDSFDRPVWPAGSPQSLRLLCDALEASQTVLIVSAWLQFGLVGFNRHYVVVVPGAGLPDGIPVKMYMNADGVPDPRVCEPVDQ